MHAGVSSLQLPFSMHVTNSDPLNENLGSQLKVTVVPTALDMSEIIKCWEELRAGQGTLQAGMSGTQGSHWLWLLQVAEKNVVLGKVSLLQWIVANVP